MAMIINPLMTEANVLSLVGARTFASTILNSTPPLPGLRQALSFVSQHFHLNSKGKAFDLLGSTVSLSNMERRNREQDGTKTEGEVSFAICLIALRGVDSISPGLESDLRTR